MNNSLVTRRMDEDYDYSYFPSSNISMPETPETAIARRIPYSAIKLLNNESKRKHYVNALSIGAGVANTFLSGLSSEDLSDISDVSIEPEVRRGFFGPKGMVISFRRRR